MINPDKPEASVADFDFAWGLFDTGDKCWMGDARGPRLYRKLMVKGKEMSAELQARAAATIMNEMFMSGHRYRGRLYVGGHVVYKDKVTSKITGAEAIRRIEGRNR